MGWELGFRALLGIGGSEVHRRGRRSVPSVEWGWACEGGMVTHLPLSQRAVERPVRAGAGGATSSQEGCLLLLELLLLFCGLFQPPGEEGGADGLSDFKFPSGFVVPRSRGLSMKVSPPPYLLLDDVLWVVV